MTATHPLSHRRAGVLCAASSLPGPHARGTLGDAALRFLDFLAESRLRVWQVLPLSPPDQYGSPYHSASAFALDPSLSADLTTDDVRRLVARHGSEFEQFRATAGYWLSDHVRFELASREYGAQWTRWPDALRDRTPSALEALSKLERDAFEGLVETQFATYFRWYQLRREAAARDVLLFGDVPLYPAHASADVWSHRTLFLLDAQGEPTAVAGVPPDYFAADGQRWGNPLYDWARLAETGFEWWLARMETQLELYDVVRLDHFRGLEAFWSIPRDAPATQGRWQPGPGAALLTAMRGRFGRLPIVAEDLGIITAAVDALRESFHLPGMRVLQFAFSGDPDNPHLPQRHSQSCVVYTGTHDNDTSLGWYTSLPPDARAQADEVLHGLGEPPWSLIELAFASDANTAIVPLQDFLGLGTAARMNTPGTVAGNWRWRFDPAVLTPRLAARIRDAVERHARV